ncbi:MAG: hypothetical protein WDW38_006466 [Sanguina aurantia]
MHSPFQALVHATFHNRYDEAPATPNQLRWDALPPPSGAVDFVDGRAAMAGGRRRRTGGARSSSADSEWLIVPQQGRLRLATELGIIDIEPLEIAVIPRGVRFRVELLDGHASGYIDSTTSAWKVLRRFKWVARSQSLIPIRIKSARQRAAGQGTSPQRVGNRRRLGPCSKYVPPASRHALESYWMDGQQGLPAKMRLLLGGVRGRAAIRAGAIAAGAAAAVGGAFIRRAAGTPLAIRAKHVATATALDVRDRWRSPDAARRWIHHARRHGVACCRTDAANTTALAAK